MTEEEIAKLMGTYAPSALSYVNPALSVVGTGLQVAGGIQQMTQADEQYKQAQEAYEAEMKRQAEEDENRKNQQYLQNMLTYGNYAGNQVQQAQASQGKYSRSIGR